METDINDNYHIPDFDRRDLPICYCYSDQCIQFQMLFMSFLFLHTSETKTGGGRYSPKLNAVGEQVLALIGDQVEPLHNIYDDGNEYFDLEFLPSPSSNISLSIVQSPSSPVPPIQLSVKINKKVIKK